MLGNWKRKRKLIVNLDKSKYLIIGKKNGEGELASEVTNGKLEKVNKYKYLGNWIDNTGQCELNILKRKEKGGRVVKKILDMAHQSRVGRQEIPLKLELYKPVNLPTLLYNLEAWGKIRPKELIELEKTQGQVLRCLMGLPTTTPYIGVLYETGIWRVEEMLVYKRMMLYHNIMNSKDSRVVKKVMKEEEINGPPGCWLEKVKEDADEMEIVINEEGCKRKMKSEFKREVKKKIQKKMISKLKSLETTKLRTVAIEGFGKKNYTSGMFNGTEVRCSK